MWVHHLILSLFCPREVTAEDLGSLPPAPQLSSSGAHCERREEKQSSLYVKSRMSPSNNKRRKPYSLQPHQSKIDSGTMNPTVDDDDDDVSSSESVKLENIHVHPVRFSYLSCRRLIISIHFLFPSFSTVLLLFVVALPH